MIAVPIWVGAGAIADYVAGGQTLAPTILANRVARIGANITAATAVPPVRANISTVPATGCLAGWTFAGAILAGHAICTTTLLAVVISRCRIDTIPFATNFARPARVPACAAMFAGGLKIRTGIIFVLISA